MYSVFCQLTFSPCLSKTSLHLSSWYSALSIVYSHITISANSIAFGGSVPMLSVYTSKMTMKRNGFKSDPTSIWNSLVLPVSVRTFVLDRSYMSLITVM